MKKSKILIIIISGILYIGLMIFFTTKCLETGEQSSESSGKVATLIQKVLNTLFNANIEINDNYLRIIRKLIGHFGFFVVLGITSIVFYLNLPFKLNIRIILHYVIAFLFAFTTEFLLEGNTDGRTASMNDVFIDYSGFISISTIILLIYLYNVKKMKKVS